MTTRSLPSTIPSRTAWGDLTRAGLLAGVVAGVANTALYYLARTLGAMPHDVGVGPAALPMTLLPIVALGLVSALAAAMIYGLLTRVTGRPRAVFGWLSAAVLLLAAIPPALIEGAPLGMIVTLELMHLVVAAAMLWGLLRAEGRAA